MGRRRRRCGQHDLQFVLLAIALFSGRDPRELPSALLDKPAPDTVNPSLWRNAQLGMLNGLFKVSEGIYQVRGYDLSNITFVKTKSGWIVFDPLISPETA